MRVTIIPVDGFVSVDGEALSGLDLSSIDASIHAVQWYGETGEVEIKDVATGKIKENREITSFSEYEFVIELLQTTKNEAEAKLAEIKRAEMLAAAEAAPLKE
jgi:hypothetical protein